MKQGINSNKLPHQQRVTQHENYNKTSTEVLAAADKAILKERLRDALKHNKFVPISLINSLDDETYEEFSKLVDALLSKGLINYAG
jgi:radical SAM superfamily enzyme YgiQ (UPF0313 family)